MSAPEVFDLNTSFSQVLSLILSPDLEAVPVQHARNLPQQYQTRRAWLWPAFPMIPTFSLVKSSEPAGRPITMSLRHCK